MRNTRIPKFLCRVFLSGCLTVGAAAAALGATGGGVSGIVRDPHGVPLAGVMVTLLQGRFNSKAVQTATTDAAGRFEIKDVLPGLYSLRANLASYLPQIKSGIGVASGKMAELSLILETLYLQSVSGSSSADRENAVKEDIESVLRSASSTRPILRVFDANAGDSEEWGQSTTRGRGGIRGVVSFSTAAFSTAPDLASAGNTFTDFAFIRDISPGTTLVVAGVLSDFGFAEVDSLVRLRGTDRHIASARLSIGILPYLSDSLTPLLDRNVRRLNMYNLDLQDEIKLSEVFSVIYGAELQMTDPSTRGSRFRPRWGFKFQPSMRRNYTFIRTSSLPQMQRTLDLGDGDTIALTSPFQHEFGNRLNFGVSRITHTESAMSQALGANSQFILGVYSDDFSANQVALGEGANQRIFNTARGARVAYGRKFSNRLDTLIGYTYGVGIEASRDFAELNPRNFHVVTARVRSEVSLTGTRFAATYRWVSGDSVTIIDPYQDLFDSASPGVSVMFAQAIPYLGRFIPGRLEAQVDMRNLFGRGTSELYQSASLRRVEFVQPTRSVRGGIKLKF
jgi:Carboxypeptidase regulatory-like domain